MWPVYIALLIAFIFVLDKILVDTRQLELAEKFNGPKRYPIIGTAYSYFGLKPDGERIQFSRTNLLVSKCTVISKVCRYCSYH